MIRLLLISLLLAAAGSGDGKKSGRDGNQSYRMGEYERAAETYRSALDRATDGTTTFALRHNLGASLYQLGRAAEAVEQFEAAGASADSPADKARAAYNAGNAALASDDFAAAADYFKEALRHEPSNENARFNYEYARRQTPPENESDQGMMEEDDQSGDGDANDSDDPSEGDNEGDQDPSPEEDGEPDDASQPQPESQDDDGEAGEQSPSEAPSQELTREQAEQILGALQQGEARLLREIQKAPFRTRDVDKDW